MAGEREIVIAVTGKSMINNNPEEDLTTIINIRCSIFRDSYSISG